MNVGKYTSNAAVNGDIGWQPMICKVKKTVVHLWSRLVNMSSERLNRKVFVWSNNASNRNCKNWNFKVVNMFLKYDLNEHVHISRFASKHEICGKLVPKLYEEYVMSWHADVNRVNAQRGNGRNKLRFYRLFKTSFHVEPYCKLVLNRSHRGALAKFRSGTAPINIEIGRYNNVLLENRKCSFCHNIGINVIEDEMHVLLHCPLYIDLRQQLYFKACQHFANFDNVDDVEKIRILLNEEAIVNCCAKTCFQMLEKRRDSLYTG